MAGRNRRIVDLGMIRRNAEQIRASLSPGVKMLAVVKANAYGHGAAECARAALAGGADMLAVASVDEGLALRAKNVTAPILTLGPATAWDVEDGVRGGLIQTVCTPEMVTLCENAARPQNKQTEVHLKMDTGMGRIGVRTATERDRVLEALRSSPHVCLTGAFTHFCDADGDEDGMRFTQEQFDRFLALTAPLPSGVLRHCSNSAAIHRFPQMQLDMVRAGISLYGYPPVETGVDVRPCMRWEARVSHVKTLPPLSPVSYGRTFRTERETRVATVTCGYADGYHRTAGPGAWVLIRGKRAKIIGRVCMDQMMADVTDIAGVVPGDTVTLMGKDGNEEITAEDLAAWSGTISYEILLSSCTRVERVFAPDSPDG